jgi:hypothetical protein
MTGARIGHIALIVASALAWRKSKLFASGPL